MNKPQHTKNFRYWFKSLRENYWPWFVAAMTALSANWAAGAIQDSVGAWWSGGPLRFSVGRTIAVTSFICFCILFVRNKNRFFAPRTRYPADNKAPEPRACLFFFLSVPENIPFKSDVPQGLELGFTHLGDDLQKIWDAKNADFRKRWNWEMPLRAIWHHVGTLNKVVLVCSAESLEQAHDFLNICLRYDCLRKQVAFLVLGYKDSRPFLYDPQTITREEPFTPETFRNVGLKGLSFDSFDLLTHALLYALDNLQTPKKDIMIDITGGKKPTSVVGAAVTFNTKIKAQYVDTEGENKVRSYDVLYVSADVGGTGI